MVRSYALAFAAVTLRVYFPAALAGGLEALGVYRAIAWLCWVPNLLVAEMLLTLGGTAERLLGWIRRRGDAGRGGNYVLWYG